MCRVFFINVDKIWVFQIKEGSIDSLLLQFNVSISVPFDGTSLGGCKRRRIDGKVLEGNLKNCVVFKNNGICIYLKNSKPLPDRNHFEQRHRILQCRDRETHVNFQNVKHSLVDSSLTTLLPNHDVKVSMILMAFRRGQKNADMTFLNRVKISKY